MIQALYNTCRSIFASDCKEKGFFLVHFNGVAGILRCPLTELDNAKALLQQIDNINHTSVAINTIATSGTIKSLLTTSFKDEKF